MDKREFDWAVLVAKTSYPSWYSDFHRFDSRLHYGMRRVIRRGGGAELVEGVKKSDNFENWQTFLNAIALMLKSGETLPPPVRDFTVSFLRGDIVPPKRPRERPTKNGARNAAIVWTVIELVEEHGLTRTRDRSKGDEPGEDGCYSACDAVTLALRDHPSGRKDINYRAVAKVLEDEENQIYLKGRKKAIPRKSTN